MKSPARLGGGAEVDQEINPDTDNSRSPAQFQPVRLGVERITTTASGTFAPDSQGQLAAVVGVHDRYGELVDLVGWHLDRPGTWWMRHGDECSLLGARALALAAWHGEAVKLYTTPESWLRARPRGRVCILRWDVDLRQLFDGVARVDCETAKLRQRLERQLRAFEPRLWAPAERQRHAA